MWAIERNRGETFYQLSDWFSPMAVDLTGTALTEHRQKYLEVRLVSVACGTCTVSCIFRLKLSFGRPGGLASVVQGLQL